MFPDATSFQGCERNFHQAAGGCAPQGLNGKLQTQATCSQLLGNPAHLAASRCSDRGAGGDKLTSSTFCSRAGQMPGLVLRAQRQLIEKPRACHTTGFLKTQFFAKTSS